MSESSRSVVLAPVRRWTYSKKFWLLHAVSCGELTRDEAQAAHSISHEEWSQWVRDKEKFGAQALRTTFAQVYRRRA